MQKLTMLNIVTAIIVISFMVVLSNATNIRFEQRFIAPGVLDGLLVRDPFTTSTKIVCSSICSTLGSTCQMVHFENSVCKLASADGSVQIQPDEGDSVLIKAPIVPVDGNWGSWAEWSSCSVSCDTGSRQRSRFCNPPLWGGNAVCPGVGNPTESEACSPGSCPTDPETHDGLWGDWGTLVECPNLSLITSFKTKVSDWRIGLTGLEAKCSGGQKIHGWVSENIFGNWAADYQTCSGGYKALRLDMVPSQGIFADDPAMVCMELQCADDDLWHKSSCVDHSNSQQHGPFSCPDGKKFCTLAQRVDYGALDNSGLNGLKMGCCD